MGRTSSSIDPNREPVSGEEFRFLLKATEGEGIAGSMLMMLMGRMLLGC